MQLESCRGGILQQKMFSLHNTRHNTLTTYTLNLQLSRISRSPAKLGEFSVPSQPRFQLLPSISSRVTDTL